MKAPLSAYQFFLGKEKRNGTQRRYREEILVGMTEAGPTTPAHFKPPASTIPITSLLSKQFTWPSPKSRGMWG